MEFRTICFIRWMISFLLARLIPQSAKLRQTFFRSHAIFGSPAPEKTEGPTALIHFLGIQLDSVNQTISLPPGKMAGIPNEFVVFKLQQNDITWFAKSYWKAQFLQLNAYLGVQYFWGECCMLRTKLSTPSFRCFFQCEILRWSRLLERISSEMNGVSSFLEQVRNFAPDLNIHTDLCGSVGCGGFCNGEWFQLKWPEWVIKTNSSTAWLKMVPVFLPSMSWGAKWRSKRLLFNTNNMAVADAWRKFSFRHKGIMDLTGGVHFQAALNDFALKIVNFPGK